MYSYEIPQKRGYPRTVFYDDSVVFYYKDGREIGVEVSDIERIDYVKPSFWNYIKASFLFGGTYPGRMEIRLSDSMGNSLLNSVNTTRLYLVKISYNNIFKLPDIFKEKMGLEKY